MHFVIINGYPTSGKDTFVDLCGKYATCRHCSSVDPAKEALETLGWNGSHKTPEIRAAISHLKDLSSRLFDGPVQYVLKEKQFFENYTEVEFLFVDAREPAELKRYKEEYGAITLFIDRKVTEPISNHADANVENFQYDYIVNNNGTLDELLQEAKKFVAFYKEG